jgi:hypothetical protein
MINTLRNLTKLQLMEDGAYYCELEMYDEWYETWTITPFVYNASDRSATKKWIDKQIEDGTAPPVTEWVNPITP